MPADISCDLCGGTDFYYDSGFYYCSECQRQTQDLQEHIFEEPDEIVNAKKKSKKVAEKRDGDKQVHRVTSWECYNYIVLGLVNELIELGASENLKSTVEVLWFKYLKALGVIGTGDAPPKLAAYNSRMDAEIIYGRKESTKKRKARSRTGSPSSVSDVSSFDHTSLKRERTKRKKALAKAEYAEVLSTTQQSDVSQLNQSLGSLKGTSDMEKKDTSKFLRYHPSASKELKKKMTKNHLKDHCRDVNSTLTCHRTSARTVSRSYLDSPYVITRNKVFAIIYIGLLINKEDIQLGDMLRYIREGHLSFEYYNHFLPEEILERKLNVCTFNCGNNSLVSTGLRVCTAKMATFLNVKKYMPVQNLVDLCKRYCDELNLPEDIYKFAIKILSRSQPKMYTFYQMKSMPNYEARAMSFIIFVLKLLFCLDDATEFEISELADVIDKNYHKNENKTFSFCKWLRHIEYRKLILDEFHFPTKYLNDNFTDPGKLIGFRTWYNERMVDEENLALDMQLIKKQLELIKDSSNYVPEKFSYKYTLTPFRDYTKRLVNLELLNEQNYFTDLLSMNFSKTSVEFLNHMQSYKESLQPGSKFTYKHGGKQDDIKIVCLYSREGERFRAMRVDRKDVKVTFATNDKRRKIKKHDKVPLEKFRACSELILQNFEKTNCKVYSRNKSKLSQKRIKLEIPENFPKNSDHFQFDSCIYNPSERFWLNMQDTVDFNTEEMKEFLEGFPQSFQLVLKEGARIIEQSEKDLYMEYNLVEAYLCYVFNMKTGKYYQRKVVDEYLKKALDRAKKMW